MSDYDSSPALSPMNSEVLTFKLSALLSEEPFQLHCPEGKTFYVHGSLLAHASKVLEKVINGQMKEAGTRIITLTANDGDIDDTTVFQFLQFAYNRRYKIRTKHLINYTGPEVEVPELREDSAMVNFVLDPAACVQSSSHDNDGRSGSPGSRGPIRWDPQVSAYVMHGPPWEAVDLIRDQKTRSAVVQSVRALGEQMLDINHEHESNLNRSPWVFSDEDFLTPISHKARVAWEFSYGTQAQRSLELFFNFLAKSFPFRHTYSYMDSLDKAMKLYKFRGPTEGSYDDMLVHARVYVFSSRYECCGLATSSLLKLRNVLASFDPYQDTAALIELVDYTYKHTPDHEKGCDRLRALLAEYTVCYYEKLMKDYDFRSLLQTNSEFMADVLDWAVKVAHT